MSHNPFTGLAYKKCKYEVREKDHIYCKRDGSIRKRGCPCAHHTLSWWDKFKMKIGL
jgi:hypothetical protein